MSPELKLTGNFCRNCGHEAHGIECFELVAGLGCLCSAATSPKSTTPNTATVLTLRQQVALPIYATLIGKNTESDIGQIASRAFRYADAFLAAGGGGKKRAE